MLRKEAERLRQIQAQCRLAFETEQNLIEVIDAMVEELDGGEVENLME